VFEIARLLQLKADSYYYLNEVDSSLAFYLKSIQVFEDNNLVNDYYYHEAISHAGFCYRELGQLNKALFFYHRAVELATELKDSLEIAASYSNLGSTYAKIGDLAKATDYYRIAYEIDLNNKDTMAIGFDLRNLSEMQVLNQNYSEAITYAKSSIILLSESDGNANSLGLRLSLLAKSFMGLEQYDSAAYYLNLSTTEFLKLGDSLNLSLNWNTQSLIELKRNNLSNALSLAQKGLQYLSSLQDESVYKIEVRETIISIYLKKEEYKRALPLIEENLKTANDLGLLYSKRNALRQRAYVFEMQNDYERAIADYKSFKLLNDSIATEETQQRLAELTIKYDVDNLNQTNNILQLENKLAKTENRRKDARLRWILFASLMTIIGITVVALMYNSRGKLKNQLLSEEIDNLRNQIKLAVEGDTSAYNLDFQSINDKLQTPLSEREIEILSLALSDMSNSQIADKVFVSVNTVKFHLKNIYDKLGVASRKEALQFALRTNH
jgi:DNA-binding CsgD family transcriptional regulator